MAVVKIAKWKVQKQTISIIFERQNITPQTLFPQTYCMARERTHLTKHKKVFAIVELNKPTVWCKSTHCLTSDKTNNENSAWNSNV